MIRPFEVNMQDIYQVIFSNSRKMSEIKGIIDEIARNDGAVLIQGENGTGKELLAEAIHLNSQQKHKPFVKVDYAEIQKGTLQIKFFDFEEDPFTGTYFPKQGKFEFPDGGTILLNNISMMDIRNRIRLFHVLQNGLFSYPGEYGNVMGHSRVIATTTDRLEKSMMEKYFRESLFFRINLFNIDVPPLRDRKEQILPLTEYYFNFYKKKYGREVLPLSPKLANDFKEYAWPGNIRELEKVVERIVINGEEDAILKKISIGKMHGEKSLEFYGNSSQNPSEEKILFNLKDVRKKVVQATEMEMIQSTLQNTHWNRKQAAKILGIGYNALLYKIQKYNLR
jgi:DNA-binding NtrC family response regulator